MPDEEHFRALSRVQDHTWTETDRNGVYIEFTCTVCGTDIRFVRGCSEVGGHDD